MHNVQGQGSIVKDMQGLLGNKVSKMAKGQTGCAGINTTERPSSSSTTMLPSLECRRKDVSPKLKPLLLELLVPFI